MLKQWMAAGRLMVRDLELEDVAALKLCLPPGAFAQGAGFFTLTADVGFIPLKIHPE